MRFVSVDRYDDWRQTARQLLQQNIGPGDVQFHSDAPSQPSLFGDSPDGPAPDADRSKPGGETSRTADSNQTVPTKPHRVPQAFLDLAEKVACHSDASRWSLLYRSLWRLTHGQANLLEISTDEDVLRMHQMEKSVRRDAHKMKAFVRFRKVPRDDGREEFVAWHRPDHFVLRLTAPFFSRRFNGMHWTIMTPFESAVWDQSSLQYGPGMPASQAPEDDELEDMWRTYYKSIFNPARVKVKMMKSEMAVRYWQRLPEAQVIDELLRQAPGRVD
ncbi:MAG: TIGR03915 family putative DNA repair protein, partial [Planctomycetota bacterium]